MDLAALSSAHGAYYAPAFAVRLAGQSLTHRLGIAVSQVEVDLKLAAAGRFSFTVVNTFDNTRHEFVTAFGTEVLDLLTFGAAVEVAMGYGDQLRLQPLISGIITEIRTGFSEGGSPELTVSGYDHLFSMTLGKGSKSWKDRTDSEVVEALVDGYHLDTDVVTTTEKHPQVEQHQESDFEFLTKLAKRNHYEFYVDGRKTLRFGPPKDNVNGNFTLTWGKDLLSFSPEANLANQVSKVEIYGWDHDKKQAIVGHASESEASGVDPRRTSAGGRVKTALGRPVVLQLRQPVFTEAEAKQRAKAVLTERSKKFVTGQAECIGLPDLRPDLNVNLAQLGRMFSKTYYIEQATHKLDSSGYRTRIKVKETSL